MHWYGKAEVARQRKVGHVTVTAATPAEARARLALIDPAAARSLEATTASAAASQGAAASGEPPKVLHTELSHRRTTLVLGTGYDTHRRELLFQ